MREPDPGELRIEAAEAYAGVMFAIFDQHSDSKGNIDDEGLARLSAHTYHCHRAIIVDMFEHFLFLLEEAGYTVPVEKFQQKRYH